MRKRTKTRRRVIIKNTQRQHWLRVTGSEPEALLSSGWCDVGPLLTRSLLEPCCVGKAENTDWCGDHFCNAGTGKAESGLK